MRGSHACCVLALLASTGCASFGTLGLARPIKQGAIEGAIGPAVTLGNISTPGGGGIAYGYNLVAPAAIGAIRYGVSDSLEIGARGVLSLPASIGGYSAGGVLFGIGLEGKYGLVQAPSMATGLDISIAPSLAYMMLGSAGTTTNQLTLTVPVQLGINFSGNQVVLSPTVADQVLFGAGSVVDALYLGGSVGFAFKVDRAFRIMPEMTLLLPFLTNSSTALYSGYSGYILQFTLAFILGGGFD